MRQPAAEAGQGSQEKQLEPMAPRRYGCCRRQRRSSHTPTVLSSCAHLLNPTSGHGARPGTEAAKKGDRGLP